MISLLGLLRAMQIHYHTLHWQARGSSFAGDHKLYKTLYKSVTDEIDDLGEKIVYYQGAQSVSTPVIFEAMNKWAAKWNSLKSEAEYAIVPELDFQFAAKSLLDQLKVSGKLTPGIDDYLMSACNKHERNLYMLKQRFDLQKI